MNDKNHTIVQHLTSFEKAKVVDTLGIAGEVLVVKLLDGPKGQVIKRWLKKNTKGVEVSKKKQRAPHDTPVIEGSAPEVVMAIGSFVKHVSQSLWGCVTSIDHITHAVQVNLADQRWASLTFTKRNLKVLDPRNTQQHMVVGLDVWKVIKESYLTNNPNGWMYSNNITHEVAFGIGRPCGRKGFGNFKVVGVNIPQEWQLCDVIATKVSNIKREKTPHG